MADIKNKISYSRTTKAIISTKVKDAKFTYQNWGDEDLASVRKEIRDHYKEEQNGICSFCQQNVSLVSALNCQVEHIVPKKLHIEFLFNEQNLCVICADCNQIKRDQETLNSIPQTMTNAGIRVRYPRSSGAFKIVHPHFDVWSEHILRFDDFYVDRTMKGHFTIGVCKLNRKLHKFGYSSEISNDDEIRIAMNKFLDEKDSIKRLVILQKIRLMQ